MTKYSYTYNCFWFIACKDSIYEAMNNCNYYCKFFFLANWNWTAATVFGLVWHTISSRDLKLAATKTETICIASVGDV